MSPYINFRRAATLILLVGTVCFTIKNGAHAFNFSSTTGPRKLCVATPRHAMSSPLDSSQDGKSECAMNSVPSYTRGRKSAIAKRAIKGFATHALKTIPSLAVGACVGASFPQSALAFTASDYISSAINTRNTIIGVSVAAATSAQIIRISRNGSMAIASSATSEDAVTKETKTSNSKKPSKIPITVLSGFLGAGKTTALKRLLENTEGIKVGTIVNDVAAVNIDAKLISNPMNNHNNGQNSNAVGKGSSGGTVELQNGCACCSLSDELLTSVSDLMEGRDLDALVVELSGVADPAAVRQNWKQAVEAKHPATLLADLSRVVTVVDSHTFGTDWMTWDTAGKRDWAEEGDICAGSRQVPELLAEQVEAADVIILNKVDLSKGEQLETAKIVSRSLNKDAEMIETSFGELEPISIIGDISALRERDEGHGHDYASNCSDPDCTDTSHNHSHDHSSHEDSCSDPGCADASHNHDHSSEACSDPDCNDSSHSHSHSHSSEACTDPDCNDASHDHSHDHKAATTSTDNLGISNFVYKSSRPFDARKLQRVLMSWPIPVMEELNLVKLGKELEEVVDTDAKSPFSNLLRSKGFVWVAPSHLSPDDPLNDLDRHDVALYWSHAGKHFGLKEAGSWWASLGKEQMKKVFEGNMDEYDRIIKEDFVSGEWGDRRQEIVFIGANLDEKGITDALDDCLCTDEQIGEYRQAILDAIAAYYTQ